MKLHVSHLTRYEYTRPVTLSPHLLFLRPRESAVVRVSSFGFNISPEARLVWTRDAHDVLAAWAYFWDGASALSIRSEFIVETLEVNPFDFILKPYATKFPFTYESLDRFNLAPYLAAPNDSTQQELLDWLQERFTNRPVETVPFLAALNSLIYSALVYVRREDHGIQSSLDTLALASGACRDYAVLFVEICRTLGLAARFVSGYHYAPPDENERSAGAMHAWAEVYLPGAGWRGIDPTHDIFCNDAFIPVAHAAVAESVNPIQGSIYSNSSVTTGLHVDVRVEKLQ